MSEKKAASIIFAVLSMAALLTLGGCTTILDKTNDKPIEEDPGRRSLGSIIDDQSIETTAGVNIRKADPKFEEANVVVTSYNGVVLLSGQVQSEELRQTAAKVVAAVKNVRQVHNYLTIGEEASFGAHSADALITTKIKTKLLTAANIKDSRVKVMTESGTAFMLGLVTHAEGKIAGNIAQNTDGVQEVVLLFEYID